MPQVWEKETKIAPAIIQVFGPGPRFLGGWDGDTRVTTAKEELERFPWQYATECGWEKAPSSDRKWAGHGAIFFYGNHPSGLSFLWWVKFTDRVKTKVSNKWGWYAYECHHTLERLNFDRVKAVAKLLTPLALTAFQIELGVVGQFEQSSD